MTNHTEPTASPAAPEPALVIPLKEIYAIDVKTGHGSEISATVELDNASYGRYISPETLAALQKAQKNL